MVDKPKNSILDKKLSTKHDVSPDNPQINLNSEKDIATHSSSMNLTEKFSDIFTFFYEKNFSNHFKTILERSVAASIFGGSFGGVLASIRNANTTFYVTTMSLNYFLIGISYFSSLEIAKSLFPSYNNTWQLHAGVGSTLGIVFAKYFGSNKKILPFSSGFVFLGVGGFFLHSKLLDFREYLKEKRVAQLQSEANSKNET